MPKKTDRGVVLRIYQLRQRGLTLNQIVEQLGNEFDESMVPDTSTVSRQAKRFETVPPEELAEDMPFSWSTMAMVPWEHGLEPLGPSGGVVRVPTRTAAGQRVSVGSRGLLENKWPRELFPTTMRPLAIIRQEAPAASSLASGSLVVTSANGARSSRCKPLGRTNGHHKP